jgi:hypothetical protein
MNVYYNRSNCIRFCKKNIKPKSTQIKSSETISILKQINYPIDTTTAPSLLNNLNHTGCEYFVHTNDSNLVTFVFSAGRHETGCNTYMTIDFKNADPFSNPQEIIINKEDNTDNGYSWVSTKSINDSHYVLFSGDISPHHVTPSIMYIFTENTDGSLNIPTLIFTEPKSNYGSRFCLLEDLGNLDSINNRGGQLISSGNIDIILLGSYGLQIYSLSSGTYSVSRTINLPQNTTSAAFLGVSVYTKNSTKYLIIGNRSRWRNTNNNNLEAPNIIYDVSQDKIINNFGEKCQTVSIGLINTNYIITGNGGEAGRSGSPNIIYKINDDMTVTVANAENQLMSTINTICQPFTEVPDDYIPTLPDINNTKTRQVLPFKIKDTDVYSSILVINSDQPSYIWTPDKTGKYTTVKKLEDIIIINSSYARGGTVYTRLIPDGTVDIYIILAIYGDKNVIYHYNYSHTNI